MLTEAAADARNDLQKCSCVGVAAEVLLCTEPKCSEKGEASNPGLGPCCPHPQPASEAKELFWVELGVGDLGGQGGELGRAEEPPLEDFLECRRGTPCLSSAFQQASCVPGSRPSRAVH